MVETAAVARSTKLVVFAAGAALSLGLLVAYSLASRGGAPSELWGVRLGDSLATARERFRAPGPGTWTSTPGDDPALGWAPASSASPVASARFEFHDGMLVAARLELARSAESADGAPLEISRAAVVSREPAGDRTRVTLLSRACPEHAAEVKRVLGER